MVYISGASDNELEQNCMGNPNMTVAESQISITSLSVFSNEQDSVFEGIFKDLFNKLFTHAGVELSEVYVWDALQLVLQVERL